MFRWGIRDRTGSANMRVEVSEVLLQATSPGRHQHPRRLMLTEFVAVV